MITLDAFIMGVARKTFASQRVISRRQKIDEWKVNGSLDKAMLLNNFLTPLVAVAHIIDDLVFRETVTI